MVVGCEFIDRREFFKALGAAALGLTFSCAAPGRKNAVKHDETGTMILIPAGLATLGTSYAEKSSICEKYNVHPSWFDPEPPRRLHIDAFYIDELPVTNRQFLQFCRESNYPWPRENHRQAASQNPKCPVVNVNIKDAAAYAQYAGKQLPTQEQWEYAARGKQGLIYPWGNRWDRHRCNNNSHNSPLGLHTTSVYQYPNGASAFGVMDMAGNVCEWTRSKHGPSNVVKGAFYLQRQPYRFRPACRLMTQLGSNRQDYIGFRCVKEIPAATFDQPAQNTG